MLHVKYQTVYKDNNDNRDNKNNKDNKGNKNNKDNKDKSKWYIRKNGNYSKKLIIGSLKKN